MKILFRGFSAKRRRASATLRSSRCPIGIRPYRRTRDAVRPPSGDANETRGDALASSSLALLCQFLAARSIIEVATRPLNRLTVTEWTESRNWTESTETYEAKRSAQANWHFSESQQGERLAAVLPPIPPRGGLAASLRGYSPKWPTVIGIAKN